MAQNQVAFKFVPQYFEQNEFLFIRFDDNAKHASTVSSSKIGLKFYSTVIANKCIFLIPMIYQPNSLESQVTSFYTLKKLNRSQILKFFQNQLKIMKKLKPQPKS